MKNLIILSLLVSESVYAEPVCSEKADQIIEQKEIKTDVPKFLEGATIIVRLKDGQESSVPAEKFKVVPRRQQYIVIKTKSSILCSALEKNRISVLGGFGAQGSLSKKVETPSKASVKTNEGIVGGLQFQRKLNDKVSIGAQVQSNKTTSLILGFDF